MGRKQNENETKESGHQTSHTRTRPQREWDVRRLRESATRVSVWGDTHTGRHPTPVRAPLCAGDTRRLPGAAPRPAARPPRRTRITRPVCVCERHQRPARTRTHVHVVNLEFAWGRCLFTPHCTPIIRSSRGSARLTRPSAHALVRARGGPHTRTHTTSALNTHSAHTLGGVPSHCPLLATGDPGYATMPVLLTECQNMRPCPAPSAAACRTRQKELSNERGRPAYGDCAALDGDGVFGDAACCSRAVWYFLSASTESAFCDLQADFASA